MKQLFKFIMSLKSFWKLYRDYGYNADELRFILTQYDIVIFNRTNLVTDSKHCAMDILQHIYEWYAKRSD